MNNQLSVAAQAIIHFANGNISVSELRNTISLEFTPDRSKKESDILWDRRIEAKGWMIETIAFLSREKIEMAEKTVLQIANKEI